MTVKHGAKLLFFDKNDKILVLRRSETHPHIPLTSDLPGGEVEHNETPEAAVIRETFEETGIVIRDEDIKLIQKRSVTAFDREYELFLYATIPTDRPDVKISWEHDRYTWSIVSEVKDLDLGFQPMLDAYLKNR